MYHHSPTQTKVIYVAPINMLIFTVVT
uniref:Uncharacterized protein n=1 Tax=Arundo donax TaxID=35708 RepID=A0A0A9BMX7_ARUDO